MSWPEYPYSAVANDESHSLANFTNDPWWKLFRNWKHLSNRGRVLSHTRYNDIEIAHDAAGTSTTETLRVSVACTPLDRIFLCLPYFVVADIGRHWAGPSTFGSPTTPRLSILTGRIRRQARSINLP